MTETDQDKWERKQRVETPRETGGFSLRELALARFESEVGPPEFHLLLPGAAPFVMDARELGRLLRLAAALADLGTGERG